MGMAMEMVDLCIVGAEGVMENGGIVNKVCVNFGSNCMVHAIAHCVSCINRSELSKLPW